MSDKVSIIIPVYNAMEYLKRTLPAARRSDYPNYELIVVDDSSTDGSLEFAEKYADVVIKTETKSAPGKARNKGAYISKGSILFFIDADVEIGPRTVSAVVKTMEEDTEISAVFGSYDDNPPHKNFFSQYKNLTHHFIHQNSRPEAGTFWAGCGAIRRDAFLEAGGFPEKYSAAAIEDVELGYILAEHGKKIKLLKGLQVKHLKRWDFLSLLKSDIFYRAAPWTILACKKGLPRDLNFSVSDRISGLIACLMLLDLIFVWRFNRLAVLFAALAALFLYLNRKIFMFFLKKKGLVFTVQAVIYHWFYFLYSAFTFLLLSAAYRAKSFFSNPGIASE